MRFLAIVELPEDAELSARLARAAYRASRHGPVALLIVPGTSAALDDVLDPVVAQDRHVHGVEYVDHADEQLWACTSSRTLVVGTTAAVRQRSHAIGARLVELPYALEALETLAGPRVSQPILAPSLPMSAAAPAGWASWSR